MKRKQADEKKPILKMGKRTKDEQHRSIQLADMQYCFANTSRDTTHVSACSNYKEKYTCIFSDCISFKLTTKCNSYQSMMLFPGVICLCCQVSSLPT